MPALRMKVLSSFSASLHGRSSRREDPVELIRMNRDKYLLPRAGSGKGARPFAGAVAGGTRPGSADHPEHVMRRAGGSMGAARYEGVGREGFPRTSESAK